MTVKSAPFYWLVCEGCGVKSTKDTDYTALSSVTEAIDDAQEQGWRLGENTMEMSPQGNLGNIGHFCQTCVPPWCLECERPITGDNPRAVDKDGTPDNWVCRGCDEAQPALH